MNYVNLFQPCVIVRTRQEGAKEGAKASESLAELWVPVNRNTGLRRWWQMPELSLALGEKRC